MQASRRTLAVAIFGFTMSLIGSGMGPLITGTISDALAPQFGAESLRYAMLIATCFLIPTAITFFLCGRAMLRDLED